MKAYLNQEPFHYVEQGPATGLPVVFLHGFPFDHSMWSPQIEALGEQYHSIAYDLRGHGESYTGDGQFTIEGHVNDLIGMLDHFRADKCVIVGLSMGGYVALRALERNPERFLAAVLCDTRSEADGNEGKLKRFAAIAAVKKTGSKEFATGFVQAVFAAESRAAKPEIIRHIQSIIERTSPLSIAGTQLALASRTDTTPSLSKISVPVLIMVGEHDVTTPPSASQAMHAAIPGSELHIISRAAHMSNLENPGEFNKHLLTFLARLRKPQ